MQVHQITFLITDGVSVVGEEKAGECTSEEAAGPSVDVGGSAGRQRVWGTGNKMTKLVELQIKWLY